jgi:hypothetical protein
LAKITPAGLVAGSGVAAYELTTSIINNGLTETAVTIAQGIAGLPVELKNKLGSDDPQVRGEALVDALAIGGVATAVSAKLAQTGYATLAKTAGSKSSPAGAAALTDDMLAEADFAGRIPTRADLENHLVNAQVSGRQISGGHNMANFESTLVGAGGTMVAKTEIAPGVYEISYQLPKGANRTPETKTVYDPAVYSDAQMNGMASEAAARAQIQFQVTGEPEQYVKVGDIWFFAPVKVDKLNGKVIGTQTVFPRIPPGSKK